MLKYGVTHRKKHGKIELKMKSGGNEMKRTVKVWVAAVMSGVLLAGGAAMTGQAPWGLEAESHSGRTVASG